VNPVITLAPDADQAIKLFFSERGIQKPLRIDLQSSGCCDPSLGLRVDAIRESDLVYEINGLTFVISPETFKLVGNIRISYRDTTDKKGFMITSEKPVSEWDGFGISEIRI
jgi:Fe-S cluster assembly iron-binding protein IscA